MKILAIRGSNIASLAGAFEVDFEKHPLAGAGLFAITGPTGSGKSTLLDVLCLALYGQTPRGDGAGTLDVPVGGSGGEVETLTARDARNLLRRGAGEGWAETDFVGADGLRYRARWEVRRARRRPTGRFQNASRNLCRLDQGEEVPIAGGASEVDEKVGAALGLSFDQFRKAVLLAQGDFAAFLRAKDKERSELLEKITGAEIYSKLSVKAWERGQNVAAKLKALDDTLVRLVPMETEERGLREVEAADRQAEIATLDERRRRLDEVARLAGEAGERAKEAEEAAKKAEEALRARDQKVGAEARAEEAKRKAAEDLAGARKRLEEKKPELERARELDVKLTAKEAERGRATGEVVEAREALEEARTKAAGLEEELRRARAAKETAAAWLAGHVSDEPLVRGWTRAGRAVEQLSKRREEIAAGRREAGTADVRVSDATARVGALGTQEAEAKAALEGAENEVGVATQAAAGIDRDQLAAASAGNAGEIEALSALEEIAGSMAREAGRLDEAGRKAVEARENAAREDAAAEEAENAAREAEERASGLAAERDAAIAARDLADRRSSLVPGEPCPLCGSPDHPWAVPGAAPADRADELDRERKEAHRSAQERAKAGAAHRKGATAESQRAVDAESAATKAGVELSELGRKWREKAADLPADTPFREAPRAPGEITAAGEQVRVSLAAARDRQAENRQQQKQAGDLDRRVGEARRKRDAASLGVEAATKKLRGAENELGEARNARAILETKIEGLASAARLLTEELDAFVADDVEATRLLEADPGTLANRWKKRVEEFLAREKDRDAASTEIGRLEPAASAENAHRTSAQAALTGKETREAELGAAVEALRKDRGGLLEGLAVHDVTRALEATVKKAEEEQGRATDEASRATAERAAAVEALAGAREAGTKAAAKAEAARALRDAALSGLGLPVAGEGTEAGIAEAVAADALRRSNAVESHRQVEAAAPRRQEDAGGTEGGRRRAGEGRAGGPGLARPPRPDRRGAGREVPEVRAGAHPGGAREEREPAPRGVRPPLQADAGAGNRGRPPRRGPRHGRRGAQRREPLRRRELPRFPRACPRPRVPGDAARRDRLALHRRGLRVARRRHSRPGGRGARRDPRRRPPDRRHLARPGAGREDRGPGEGRRPRGRPERGAGRRRVGPMAGDIAIATSADKYA